jgi:RND family efflux transporter MFP subunit
MRPAGDDGEHVVKNPATGAYFQLGPEESFLLSLLDGRRPADEVRAAFAGRFGGTLGEADLDEFIELARSQGLLAPGQAAHPPERGPSLGHSPAATGTLPRGSDADVSSRQSLLYWRRRLFDPDRLFARVEPSVRFLWTAPFLAASAAFALAAIAVFWANCSELVTQFPDRWRWENVLLAWFVLAAATTCHEFAHGLTCKHFGGEVRDVGFLLMYFMPCFYCDVSDAWLFRERARRLWVTFAGGYCDLLVWSAAVFVWRATLQDTVANYLARLALSVCGARIFFNLNPLLKLDGYYLLSDLLRIPNLRQRGWDRLMGHVRWALWGAARPAPEPRGRLLLAFGAAAWAYSAAFLVAMLAAFLAYGRGRVGFFASAVVAVFGVISLRGVLDGVAAGEVRNMIFLRRRRLAAWSAGVLAVGVALAVIPMHERASGPCELRPAWRAEVRAPVGGFVRDIPAREGESVEAGALLARLEVPDLSSQYTRKRAELDEARAAFDRQQTAPAGVATGLANAGQAADAISHAAAIREAAAHIARQQEEFNFLAAQWQKQWVRSPGRGVVVTPHLEERVGQFLHEGDAVCTVEDCSAVEAEVALAEQDVALVRPGQDVEIKARGLPFETLRGRVTRVAPAVTKGPVQGAVTVYCRIEGPPPGLRGGMSGTARIDCGRSTVGRVIVGRCLRYLRTEFWW